MQIEEMDRAAARPFGSTWSADARVDRLLRGLSQPDQLSPELRWKLAARGISVDVLRECLDLLDMEAEGRRWPSDL